MTSYGKPILSPNVLATPRATLPVMGPRYAMAEVIAQYLRCAVFRVAGGTAPSHDFCLQNVQPFWPDPSKGLDYPCASIVESTDTYYEDALVPFADEKSLGKWDSAAGVTPDPARPQTVLWHVAEGTCDFQIDFWTSAPADRQAIEAGLSYLFNPGQDRTGVILTGHPCYYEQPVRVWLLSHRQIDEDDQVYANERRLSAMVRSSIAVVDLRVATLLTPRTTIDVTEEPI